MSIKYNNKVIAGKYKEQIIPFANTVDAGIAKIATQEEINKGTDNSSIVTPVYLAQKQDKLIAGDGININEANIISSKITPDKVTIIENENNTISTIGRKTVNENIIYDWEGTEAEYHQAIMNNEIDPDWYCYITDDELAVSYDDVLSRTLVNIAPDGIKVLGASSAYLTNDVYIDETGYNQLLELKNSAIKIDGVDSLTINGQKIDIPYVLTHTGSKITDAKYRDILVEFYNENGYTNYFTIDEENKNYTLPMGEIYGKIITGASNTLTKNQITNCLTEIPNRINLDLTDGVLTLKKGSVVTVPNGVNVFDEITLSKDLSLSQNANTICTLFYYPSGARLVAFSGTITSGEGDPSYIGYNTTTNKVLRIPSSGDKTQLSFPIAIIRMEGTSVTEILEVFDGFGYIGSTIWAERGVKGLIADGRNVDGTCKNIAFETTKVITRTFDSTIKGDFMPCIRNSESGFYMTRVAKLDSDNFLYSYTTGGVKQERVTGVPFCKVNFVDGVVANFEPYTAFRAIDFNEFSESINAFNESIDNKVSKSGDTMTGNLEILKNSASLNLKSTNLTQGTSPSSNIAEGVFFQDKNGATLGNVRLRYNADGSVYTTLSCDTLDGSSAISLNVGYDANGNATATIPTPATTDNSNRIATTGWVNNNSATIAGWAMPSSKRITVANPTFTYDSSKKSYFGFVTAPANGWYAFVVECNNRDDYIQCYNETNGIIFQTPSTPTAGFHCFTLPFLKGHQCRISYTTAPTLIEINFIYAEGAK